MKNLYLILFFILGMMACKPKPIEIEIKQADPRLVVYSQYVNGGYLVVSLTKSFPARLPGNIIDSNGFHLDSSIFVNNAEVWLKGANLELKLEQFESGLYACENAFLNDGETYLIEVIESNRDFTMGSTQKMKIVRFDSVAAYSSRTGTNNNTDVYYSFTNNKNEENYYVVNYFTKKERELIPEKPDADYIARRMLQQNVSFDLLTDKDFANGKIQVYKTISNNYAGDTLVLGLSNISKGYFHFLEAQKRAGILFNQLTSEVINFPTNINNGYGYFNLHEPDIRILELK
ncbi:MAG: DUF4249 family protein [Bacteroidota bacterium]|nr:DUF4249 family protein [Bacteroidota bacterium]